MFTETKPKASLGYSLAPYLKHTKKSFSSSEKKNTLLLFNCVDAQI